MALSIPKVFIDTNVWFSAFYSSANSEKLIKAHINQKIKAVVSQKVLEELVTNIRRKIPSAMAPMQTLFESAPPVVIKNADQLDFKIKECVNDKDQMIFQSAVNSRAEYFVTGNLKDFKKDKIEKTYKIKIVSPKEAVERLNL
jgi:putative PIN family toxin of toxin-antitoxin system